jgi:hypothetical protein
MGKVKRIFYSKLFAFGLTTMLVFMGFTYFNMADQWQEVATVAADRFTDYEVNSFSQMQGNPLFRTVSSVYMQYLFFIGIFFTIFGFIGVLKNAKRKRVLRILGSEMVAPAIIGLLSFVALMLLVQGITMNTFGVIFLTLTYSYKNPQFISCLLIFACGLILRRMGK